MSALVTILTGTVVPEKKAPTAVPTADPSFGVLGSVVRLDGQQSSDPSGNDLTFSWSFVTIPIGSQVATEGFKNLDADGSAVSFSPDIVGEYVIGLVVSNGVFSSVLATTRTSIRAILVPHARGFIPDGKFIFKYIRDVWQRVENRELFETFFSALLQIAGGEFLKLYQTDFNKSIRDIQDLYQRRWLKYEPKLDIVLDDVTMYLGDTAAGVDATTVPVNTNGLGIIVSDSEMLVVAGSVVPDTAGDELHITYDLMEPSNVGQYTLFGTNANKTGYKLSPNGTLFTPTNDEIVEGCSFDFPFQSRVWNVGAPSVNPEDYAVAMSEDPAPAVWMLGTFNAAAETGLSGAQVGDVIWLQGGPNAGLYRILAAQGTFVLVDHAPPSFQDVTLADTFRGNVYRPVGYKLDLPAEITTDTFGVGIDTDLDSIAPGRVVTFGTQAFELLRASSDPGLASPMTLITTDQGVLVANLTGQPWRIPHTVVSKSQDFEALGVSIGDLLLVDVVNQNTQTIVTVPCTIVGVTGNRFGFVITNQPLTAGVVPPIPNDVYLSLAKTFGIKTVTVAQDGSITFSGDAQDIITILQSGSFGSEFYNVPLTISSQIKIENGVFLIEPRMIIRNRLIPVDEGVKSIPALQEWIAPPTVMTDDNGNLFQVASDGSLFPLIRPPLLLIENNDYIVDNELAFSGDLTFKSGSMVIDVDDGAFIDRGLVPGDDFIVETPITLAATYKIAAVLSQNRLLLSAPIPKYVLGDVVTARVRIERKRTGHFIRIIPGAFTPAMPAPNRFWAEVTFFDNGPNIEGNFGLAVGLTKKDLENITSDINYRQSVAGLMYAYTRGSALNKLKLGAQVFLGLPFAEVRGVIRSIEQDYRLDANGNSIEGRILVEDIDEKMNPLGTLRVYIFPIDSVSDLSGMDLNPATGKVYQVGDVVEQFASLSKCVAVDDYLTRPLSGSGFSAVQQLQQFHSVRVRANDTIFSLSELGLLSSFLKKITPHNIAFAIVEDSEFEDDVSVTDAIFTRFVIDGGLVDNASFSIDTPLMFDERSVGALRVVEIDAIYTRRTSARDGVTTLGSAVISSATAHFITPGVGDGPVTRVGDKVLVLIGVDAGIYTVGSVVDGAVTVSDGPAQGFQAATGLHVAVVRPVTALLRADTANVVNGNAVVQLPSGGLLEDLVGPNDLIIIADGGGVWHRHQITAVLSDGTHFTQVQVTPVPGYSVTGGACEIYREAFLTNPYTGISATLTVAGGVPTLSPAKVKALLDRNDELVKQAGDQLHMAVIDPVNLTLVPTPADGSYLVWVGKKGRSQTPIAYDHLQLDPFDPLDMALIGTALQATCTALSKDVALTVDLSVMNVRPGDSFQALSGPNSGVDVGYGAGVYPIAAVLDASHIRLSIALTQSGSPSWKIIRRR